jgi:acetyl esterase/lipase
MQRIATSSSAAQLCAFAALIATLSAACSDESESASGGTPASSSATGSGGSGGAGGSGGTGPLATEITTECDIPPVPLQADVNLAQDLAYGADPAQTLDIAWPKTPGPMAFPLVVVVHGGGWAGGDKLDERDHILQLAGLGYAAASVNYRLAEKGSTENRFPAAVEDLRCSLRWLRKEVVAYGIDPNRVGVLGGSTGAHLAAMLGTASEAEGLDGTCDVEGDVKVSAVAAYYGIYDVRDDDGSASVENFLGAAPSASADLAKLASPITHIDGADAPFVLVHGDADSTIPIDESKAMRAALWSALVPTTLVEIAGADHAFDMLGGAAESVDLHAATCTTLAFFKLVLKP